MVKCKKCKYFESSEDIRDEETVDLHENYYDGFCHKYPPGLYNHDYNYDKVAHDNW
jgi:hypothetical protein